MTVVYLIEAFFGLGILALVIFYFVEEYRLAKWRGDL